MPRRVAQRRRADRRARRCRRRISRRSRPTRAAAASPTPSGDGDCRLPVIVVKTLECRQYLAPPLGVGDQFASNLAGRDAIEGGVNGGELRAMGQFTGLGEPQRHRSGLLIGIA